MQDFVQKAHIRDALGAGTAGLDINRQAVKDQRQPADQEISEFCFTGKPHTAGPESETEKGLTQRRQVAKYV